MKYEPVIDDSWIEPKHLPFHKIACCDCGLVYLLEFRVVRGRVQFRAWRDKRATAQKRRRKQLKAILARIGLRQWPRAAFTGEEP